MATHGTSEIDHGYTYVSSNGGNEGATRRQAAQDTMAQGRQRRSARTREGFFEHHLGRKHKERTSEVARGSEVEKLDVMIMGWAQFERRKGGGGLRDWEGVRVSIFASGVIVSMAVAAVPATRTAAEKEPVRIERGLL